MNQLVGDRACRQRGGGCRRVGGDRGKTVEQEKVQKTHKGDLGGSWGSRTTFQAGKCCAFLGLPKRNKEVRVSKMDGGDR